MKYVKFFLKVLFGRSRYCTLVLPKKKKVLIYDAGVRQYFPVYFRNYVDVGTIQQIFKHLEYINPRASINNRIRRVYDGLCNTGHVPFILDLGANCGCSSIFFACEYPNSVVAGIEPDKGNFELAQKNTDAFDNIVLLQAAASGVTGHCQIENPNEGNNAFRISRSDTGPIDCFSIDNLRERFNVTDLFIVKIDIEGHESDLFSENLDWMDSTFLIIIELHDWMDGTQNTSQPFLGAAALKRRSCILGKNVIFSFKN